MQAYIPEFILAGLAMILLLAETFFKKAPKFVFGLIGAAFPFLLRRERRSLLKRLEVMERKRIKCLTAFQP